MFNTWIKAVGEYGDASLVSAPPYGNVNCVDRYGDTALMVAAYHDHVNAMEALLAAPGIDVNKRNGNKWTAAHWACYGDHDNPRVIELLVSHDADMTVCDVENWTPICYAAFWGRARIASFLLTLHEVCDALDIRNSLNDETAEEVARSSEYTGIARMIATAVRFECDMSYLLKHKRAVRD